MTPGGARAAVLSAALWWTGPAVAQDIVPFDPEYAPLSFQDEDDVPDGFDVAVARALAERMDMEIAFRPEFFSVIKSGRWPDDWAFTVASMSASPDRIEVFDFVGPYYFDAVVVVAHEGNSVSSLSEIDGARIGVCAGCVYAEFVTGAYRTVGGDAARPFGASTTVPFRSETDMLRVLSDLEQDQIDFAITSIHKADYFITNSHSLRKIGVPLFLEPVWIAIPKGRPEILAGMEEAFAALKAEGVLAALSTQYLGADYTALDEPQAAEAVDPEAEPESPATD